MLIRLSHKIERVVIRHWKISLYLTSIVFFTLLIICAYFKPDIAKIVLWIILGFDLFFVAIGSLCSMLDFHSAGKVWMILATIVLILGIALAGKLGIFNGWGFIGIGLIVGALLALLGFLLL